MPMSERAPQPGSDNYDRDFHGFCKEMLQQAAITVETCEGYSKILPAMRAIMGSDTSTVPKGRSTTQINEIGRCFEIMLAHATDTKPSSAYRTFNQDYAQLAEDLGKMWTIWYYNNAIDQKYGSVVAYAAACASGYAHQTYNKFVGDIDVAPFDGRDVLPVDPFDNTIQSSYGVIIKRAVPLSWAQAMFPHLASQLERDAVWEPPTKVPELTRDMLARQKTSGAPFFAASVRQGDQPAESRGRAIRVVYLYWFYFSDPTINDSKESKEVGDFDENHEAITNYSYVAKPGDLLYPRKRLAIFSPTVPCYDGPNHYWHGMFPVSKYTTLPVPWSWLGLTPIWDCLEAQNTLTNCLRVLEDHIRKQLRPPLSSDMNTSETALKQLSENIALPGATLRSPNGSIKVEQIQPLDQAFTTLLSLCLKKIPERCGIDDLQELTSLKQLPSADSLEKVLFATAPALRWRSRMLELFYREQGRMFAFNAAQFYTVRKKFRMLGASELKPTDYDYDPSTFIPRVKDDKRTPMEAASDVLGEVDFYTVPSSLLRSAGEKERAEALALFRLGAIGIKELHKRLDSQNVEAIFEELMDQWKMKLQLAQSTGGSPGGAGPDDGIPQRPMGGDPRGRKMTGDGAPTVRDSGNMESQR